MYIIDVQASTVLLAHYTECNLNHFTGISAEIKLIRRACFVRYLRQHIVGGVSRRIAPQDCVLLIPHSPAIFRNSHVETLPIGRIRCGC